MSKFEENKEKLVELFHEGKSCRDIAQVFGVHHNTISAWLKKVELTPVIKKKSIDIVEPGLAKCSKCGEIKPLSEYTVNRPTGKYPYTLSYCNTCKNKQINDNLNNNPEKFLKNSFNKLKLRAEKEDILFDLDFEYIWDMFIDCEGLCFYSNTEMSLKAGEGHKKDTISFDKIVPEKGYTKGNVVLCSNKFNSVKNSLTLEELALYIPLFYDKIINSKWIKIN